MNASLVQVTRDGRIKVYYHMHVFFIVDLNRQAGYLKHESGYLIERFTGPEYINYGLNYLNKL